MQQVHFTIYPDDVTSIAAFAACICCASHPSTCGGRRVMLTQL